MGEKDGKVYMGKAFLILLLDTFNETCVTGNKSYGIVQNLTLRRERGWQRFLGQINLKLGIFYILFNTINEIRVSAFLKIQPLKGERRVQKLGNYFFTFQHHVKHTFSTGEAVGG